VTKRLQVPFDAMRNDELPLVLCTVVASTLHSGASRKWRIGS